MARSVTAYSLPQIALHWLTIILIAIQYATSGSIARTHEVHAGGLAPNPDDLFWHSVHNRTGLLIGLVIAVRLLLRWLRRGQSAEIVAANIRQKVANFVHFALYAVLSAQVVSGFVASYLWWPASMLHGPLFYLLLALVFVHVFAAFWHQWVLRDDTMRKMLP